MRCFAVRARYCYFVANTPGGKWTKLPNVWPDQLISARQLARFFTGDLNAPVKGHPPFPGTEKAYLRAQIARINADCELAPAGIFGVSDDNKIEAGACVLERQR